VKQWLRCPSASTRLQHAGIHCCPEVCSHEARHDQDTGGEIRSIRTRQTDVRESTHWGHTYKRKGAKRVGGRVGGGYDWSRQTDVRESTDWGYTYKRKAVSGVGGRVGGYH
jgi:hypothetical protein